MPIAGHGRVMAALLQVKYCRRATIKLRSWRIAAQKKAAQLARLFDRCGRPDQRHSTLVIS
jgi:hypothetical protein